MVSISKSAGGFAARITTALAITLAVLALGAASAFAASASVRVEGSQHTLFRGVVPIESASMTDTYGLTHVQTGNPLSVVDAAARVGAFPYELKSSSMGLYILSIGGEQPVYSDPYPGWMYRVNDVDPGAVGAADYALKSGDRVLWYYGVWGEPEAAASVPGSYVAAGTTATVLAQQIDSSGARTPLPGATVHVGRNVVTADGSGVAAVRLDQPGDYSVLVEKDGCIRSEIKTVRVRYATRVSGLSASKTKIRRGAHVILTGTITAPGKLPSYKTITLWSCKRGSKTWVRVASVKSSATGAFHFSVKPKRSVSYRAAFAGDSQFRAATGASRYVTVR